ncbi:ADP-ribosylation factor-like protein 6-interacting protein 1 [Aplysia californica]|uniref:ADP-ribosylation factor-like protein 6-interacting protein 1 n=1 Tax=Aplysia californica TaxID=6500 RepID=A0ABM0ZZZ7_APLCA|nr:ADP-ribosylation factor-like protein 6-interacting protein 1 [Aplysia californica]
MKKSTAKYPGMQDLSHLGGGEMACDEGEGHDLKRDFEGWREVLIPLASVLKWDQPYYPAILVGVSTFLFSIVWYTEMSALTTISLTCMLVGIVDFIVPFFGKSITGYHTWTANEEMQFTEICDKISAVRQDVVDMFQGLSEMRQQNAKLFFVIVMGVLTVTAWIGNLIDNLFLTYLIVNAALLLPGMRHHGVAHKYLQPVLNIIDRLKTKVLKNKTS